MESVLSQSLYLLTTLTIGDGHTFGHYVVLFGIWTLHCGTDHSWTAMMSIDLKSPGIHQTTHTTNDSFFRPFFIGLMVVVFVNLTNRRFLLTFLVLLIVLPLFLRHCLHALSGILGFLCRFNLSIFGTVL